MAKETAPPNKGDCTSEPHHAVHHCSKSWLQDAPPKLTLVFGSPLSPELSHKTDHDARPPPTCQYVPTWCERLYKNVDHNIGCLLSAWDPDEAEALWPLLTPRTSKLLLTNACAPGERILMIRNQGWQLQRWRRPKLAAWNQFEWAGNAGGSGNL